jgi:DNA modification methylase
VIERNKIYLGDNLATLKTWPDACVQTCVTSPPYFGLRDYGMPGQIGLEDRPEQFVERLVAQEVAQEKLL